MADDDSKNPPPPFSRPANTNREAKVRTVRPSGHVGSSREAKFIGYVVLGFGLLAVVAVALLALNMRQSETTSSDSQYVSGTTPEKSRSAASEPGKKTVTVPPANTDLTQRASKGLMSDFLNPDQLKPKTSRSDQAEGLYFPRQRDFAAAAVEGSWQAPIANFAAALEMRNGTYQLIMADPKVYSRRLYSSGTYVVTEDIIQLQPRKDWPAPTPPANTDVYYDWIGNAPFPVIVSLQKGKMVWQKPPASETRVRQIRSIPFVITGGQDYIVWQLVKK